MVQYGAFVQGKPRMIWDLCDDIAHGYALRGAIVQSPLKRKYYQLEAQIIDKYVRGAVNTFDSVLVIHDKDADAVRPDFAGTITVVPNAFQIDQQIPKIARTTPVILFTGCMDSWPNRDAVTFFVSDILPSIADVFPDVVFQIVGSGSDGLNVPGTAHISVTGYVESLSPYYAGCDVFVCPLRTGTGIKNKMLDAMATSCAIVTTSVGAEGLRVTHGRDVMIANTANEFVTAIRVLLQDGELRRYLGTNARALAEHHFSSNITASRLATILSNCGK